MDLEDWLPAYLRRQRAGVLSRVEGASERELRMPRTASGTNLLGVVKHLTGVEAEYFGICVGRPWPEALPDDPDAEPNADMWARADETPAAVVARYRSAAAWADQQIAELPIDAPAHVPWWSEPDTTLGRLLVHMVAETARHAGHLDILREQADSERGIGPDDDLAGVDAAWWSPYVDRLSVLAEASDDTRP